MAVPPAEEMPATRAAGRRLRWRRSPTAVFGMAVLATMAAAAVAAPLVAPFDPLAIDIGATLQGPSSSHLLGTDHLGRDVLSRVVYGSRLSLGTAALAALIVMTIGVSVGLLAGLQGGWVDGLCMRVVDGLLAFPSLVLVLAIAGTLEGGLLTIVVGFAAVSWATYARMVRGLVLQIRDRPFVEAARAMGASSFRVGWHHVMPSVMGPVLVLLSLEMGSVIAGVSALSFLGVGANPPAPEWGAMLNDGRDHLRSAPHLMIFPGAALTLAVLGCTLLGEGMRDMIDPKSAWARTRRTGWRRAWSPRRAAYRDPPSLTDVDARTRRV